MCSRKLSTSAFIVTEDNRRKQGLATHKNSRLFNQPGHICELISGLLLIIS